jgi:putative Ca2+/H+ antiporter (TMEM165/GDT1 family)
MSAPTIALQAAAFSALAELGDKTQWMALSLALRWRKPWVVLGGVFLGTVAGNLLLVAFGGWVSGHLGSPGRWLGLAFLGFAAWMLRPEPSTPPAKQPLGRDTGLLLWTAGAIFLADLGDKTQALTLALALRHPAEGLWVALGGTLGSTGADALAVFAGAKLTARLGRLPLKVASAAVFAGYGVFLLAGGGS